MRPLQLINKRPLSPDVLELDNKGLHYKMPWGAISSIMNRGTGVALSVGGWLGTGTGTGTTPAASGCPCCCCCRLTSSGTT
jgi:succinate dehydrogenase (ubiquinone) cytochrome b560 subunit